MMYHLEQVYLRKFLLEVSISVVLFYKKDRRELKKKIYVLITLILLHARQAQHVKKGVYVSSHNHSIT